MTLSGPFDGVTYVRSLDFTRMATALQRVFVVASTNQYKTLNEIQKTIQRQWGEHYSEAGISARLRDVRKEKFGGHRMESVRLDGGLWGYRIQPKNTLSSVLCIVDPDRAEIEARTEDPQMVLL